MSWLPTLVLLSSLVLGTLAEGELQCAVDERLNLALRVDPEKKPEEILLVTEDKENEDACYRACCDIIQSGGSCNAASFFREDGKNICINAICEPFHSCTFEPHSFGLAAKLALLNTTVDFDETEAAENETLAEEIEEEIEQVFESHNESDAWNIEYEGLSTTTFDFSNGDYTTESWESGQKTGEEEGTTHEDIDHQADTEHQQDTDHQEDEGEVEVVEPGSKKHGNSGIYGPNEVAEISYSDTPMIVVGVVVTVLLLLILLVFVGRRILHQDRLKYRPLRDSFPAANAYHDLEQYDDK